MKVIINQTGEVKNVALGYAVNYLLPKKLAEIATKKRLEAIKLAKAESAANKEEKAGDEHQQAERLDGKVIEFKGETVTKKKIATSLKILKTNVILPKQIRKPGEYQVELKFGASKAKVKVKVIAKSQPVIWPPAAGLPLRSDPVPATICQAGDRSPGFGESCKCGFFPTASPGRRPSGLGTVGLVFSLPQSGRVCFLAFPGQSCGFVPGTSGFGSW